jgi:prepilin-type N-terminal cleavage/methylation domain-containing protein
MHINKKAFTLIELLVAVLIIGILAAIALPQYQKIVLKTKVERLQPILSSLHESMKRYKLINGDWPKDFDELDIQIPSISSSPYNGRFAYIMTSSGIEYVIANGGTEVIGQTRTGAIWAILPIYGIPSFRTLAVGRGAKGEFLCAAHLPQDGTQTHIKKCQELGYSLKGTDVLDWPQYWPSLILWGETWVKP